MFKVLVASAAALRVSTQEENQWTAKQVMKKCDKDNSKTLDYKEVTACMDKAGMSEAQKVKLGDRLTKFAFIPGEAWEPMAEGIAKKVLHDASKTNEVYDAIKRCDTNGNGKLSYKETKKCLEAHKDVLELHDQHDWDVAKDML